MPPLVAVLLARVACVLVIIAAGVVGSAVSGGSGAAVAIALSVVGSAVAVWQTRQ